MSDYFYDGLTTDLGLMEITASNSGLKSVHFVDFIKQHRPNEITILAKQQLREYFRRERKLFNLPLEADGTDFQKNVWQELVRIPYGTTCTYGYIAKAINNPKGMRAVGLANGRNPLTIVVPCHRVIGANGKLTGYAHGTERKAKLLLMESYDE